MGNKVWFFVGFCGAVATALLLLLAFVAERLTPRYESPAVNFAVGPIAPGDSAEQMFRASHSDLRGVDVWISRGEGTSTSRPKLFLRIFPRDGYPDEPGAEKSLTLPREFGSGWMRVSAPNGIETSVDEFVVQASVPVEATHPIWVGAVVGDPYPFGGALTNGIPAGELDLAFRVYEATSFWSFWRRALSAGDVAGVYLTITIALVVGGTAGSAVRFTLGKERRRTSAAFASLMVILTCWLALGVLVFWAVPQNHLAAHG